MQGVKYLEAKSCKDCLKKPEYICFKDKSAMGRQDCSLSRDVTSNDILSMFLSSIHDKNLSGEQLIFFNKTSLGIK